MDEINKQLRNLYPPKKDSLIPLNQTRSFEPYRIPIDDIFTPYIPPKKWEPSVGDIVYTLRPFKVYTDHNDGWLEICDSNGNCLKVSKKELHKHFYSELNKDFIMKAMKDAVLTVAT